MWFRIELNKDRSVKSCVEVESSLKDGRSVHYIEADSKAAAIRILAARYDRFRSRHNDATARYKKRLREDGLCEKCKNPTHDGRWICDACRDRRRQRARELAKGAPSKNPPRLLSAADKAARFSREVESSRERGRKYKYRLKMRALRRVLAALDSLAPADFRAWLLHELDACTSKVADPAKAA